MSKAPLIEKLNVVVDLEGSSRQVGVLALDGPDLYFEYSEDFQKSGLELSPLHLNAKRKLYKNPGRRKDCNFLPGVFIDSLAEGWGSEVRAQEEAGRFKKLNILQRLASIGDRGLGALRYEPEQMQESPAKTGQVNLSNLAKSARRFSKNRNSELDQNLLFSGSYIGGSSAKALIGIDPKSRKIFHGVYQLSDEHELYIVKFHLHNIKNKNPGALEYLYSILAKETGIDMPETKLIEIGSERLYAVKRFERLGNNKLHMHSLVNLIDAPANKKVPYEAFFKTTMFLTKDVSQVIEVYKRMSFSIALHNRDDHPGNHMFLMNAKGEWRLSPAFDVSFAQSPGHHLAMNVNGKSEYTQDDLVKIGINNGISAKKCRDIQKQILSVTAKFPKLAKKLDIDKEITKTVSNTLSTYFGKQLAR